MTFYKLARPGRKKIRNLKLLSKLHIMTGSSKETLCREMIDSTWIDEGTFSEYEIADLGDTICKACQRNSGLSLDIFL